MKNKTIMSESLAKSIEVARYQKKWICECHFVKGHPALLSNKDDPDWFPTVNMGYSLLLHKEKRFDLSL